VNFFSQFETEFLFGAVNLLLTAEQHFKLYQAGNTIFSFIEAI
jgi:hypothetical protein